MYLNCISAIPPVQITWPEGVFYSVQELIYFSLDLYNKQRDGYSCKQEHINNALAHRLIYKRPVFRKSAN
jgi:hypothetical protein